MVWSEKVKYEGYWREDCLHKVKGKLYFETGEVYDGHWEDNIMHGKCMLHRKDGTAFIGVFESGEPAKIGVIVYGPGHKYEGELSEFMPNGPGKLTFPDGRNWEGEFAVGKMHGEGVMRKANGLIIRQGQWSNNEFVGKGSFKEEQPSMSR